MDRAASSPAGTLSSVTIILIRALIPQIYDLTGLDVSLLLTKPTGAVVNSSGKMYIRNGSDNRPQVVQRTNGYRSYVCDISGVSTYKWRWRAAPNPDRPHNDLTKSANAPGQPFPAPQLYALGYLYPFASAQRVVASGGTDAQFTLDFSGKGDVMDGWYPSWHPQYTTIPASVPTVSDFRYKILTATMEADADEPNAMNAKVTLAPKAHSELKMVNTASTIKGKADCGTAEGIFPLMLGAPTPKVRPDLGDQGDVYTPTTAFQYVYGSDPNTAANLLKIPGEIWLTCDVQGSFSGSAASAGEANWLLQTPDPTRAGRFVHSVGLQFDSNIPTNDLLGWSLNAAQGGITVNTAGYTGNNFVFGSLPASNDSFGNHTLTLQVNTDPTHVPEVLNGVSDTAHFQTFYKGTDSTWPGSDGKPNWWHYYNQVFPATGSINPQTPVYSASYLAGAGPSKTTTIIGETNPLNCAITIQDDAYKKPDDAGAFMRVFDISPDVDPQTGTNLVRYIGKLYLGGLAWYTYVAAHEQGHVISYVTPDGTGAGNIIAPRNGKYNPPLIVNTSDDEDDVSDWWENTHHLNPYRPDTTHGLANYGSAGDSNVEDDQILADIPALGQVLGFAGANAWNKDWADGGLNFGAPYFVKDLYPAAPGEVPRTGQPLVFYMKFIPAVAGTGATPFQPNQTYEIRNEQDLRAQYPTLLTNIAQLNP